MNAFRHSSLDRLPSPVSLSEPLRVVVIYDTPAAAAYAQEAVQMMAVTNQWQARIQSSLWSFGMLERLDTRHASVRRAAEADVILVAAAAASTLPPHVTSWFHVCLRENRHGAPVIAAVYNPAGSANQDMPLLRRDLTAIAAQWRTPVLYNHEMLQKLETELQFQHSGRHRIARLPQFALENLLTGPQARRWGIND